MLLAVLILAVMSSAAGHGHLTTPARRMLKDGETLPSGQDYIEDEDAPISASARSRFVSAVAHSLTCFRPVHRLQGR